MTLREEAGGVGAVEGPVVPAIARLPTGWMAIASPPSGASTTTGLRTIASVDRIATCGWLMIGIVSTEPAEPLLVIVNVPPRDLVGHQLLGPGPVGEVVDLPGDGAQPLGRRRRG